jgi:hypothetical protein
MLEWSWWVVWKLFRVDTDVVLMHLTQEWLGRCAGVDLFDLDIHDEGRLGTTPLVLRGIIQRGGGCHR